MEINRLTKKQLIDQVEKLLTEQNKVHKQEPSSLLKSAKYINTLEKKFNDLFESSPDMLFTIKPNGEIIWVNRTGAKTLGYSRNELIGQPVWKVVHKESLSEVKSKISSILKERKIHAELYFHKVKKDGGKIYVHERTQLVFNNKGIVSEIRIICRDVSKAKLAEDALRIEEEKFRSISNNLNVGIYRSTADEEGKFIDFNPAFMKMFGYKSRKELLAINVSTLYVIPGDRKKLLKAIIKEGSVRNKEFLLQRKNGSQFVASISTVITKENGLVKYYDGIIEDISDRKASELALINSEHKYRTLVESFSDIIFITDYESKMLYANPALKKQTGYDVQDFQMPQKDNPFIHPEDAEHVGKFITHFIKSKRVHSDIIENRFLDRTGQTHWYSSVISKIEFEHIPALQFIVRDITKQKEALNKLLKSEEQYRTLFSFSPDGILIEKSDGTIIDVNPAFCRTLGYRKDELVGQKVHMLSTPDTIQHVDKNIHRLNRGKFLKHIEKSLKKDGTEVMMELNERKFVLPDGIPGIICIAEDITKRAKAEENLKNSEESYRGLFNSTKDAIYIQDKEGYFVDVNNGAIKMYGYPRKYFIGKTPEFLAAPGMNDMNKAIEKVQKAFQGKPQSFEFWGIDRKGRIFPKEVRLNKGRYFDKDVVIAFAQDITERKKADEAIRESQRRLSTLMSNLPGMAYRCMNDKNWTMEFVSEGCLELTGYKSTDLLGNRKISYNDLIHPEDQTSVWESVQDGVAKHQPFIMIYRINTKNGKLKWVWEQGTGIYSGEGNLIALEGFISNITEQKLAEEEIRKLSRSVEQSPTIVVITNLKGSIEYVNPKFVQVTGYSVNEVLGKNPRILKSGKTPEETFTALWQTIVSGKEWSGEFINKKKNGETYWESANIFPLKDDKGRITHFIAMKEDITTRKKMEQELINAKEKAEESDKLKSAFLANMSHEIRTPMNAIIGFSQLLSESDITKEDQDHYISLIQKSGGDLLGLIDDIIDISKIEAGQLKIYKSDYFVDSILTEIYESYVEFLKTTDNKNEIELKYKRTGQLKKIVVYTDIDKLKQVIRNLLNNAIKFTDFGLIEFGAEIESNGKGNAIQFYVRDTGVGIPEDKLDVIFESFRQLDVSNKRLYGGTGLGLAITKKIVEILGGKIWVKSAPGQGSTFYFSLPYNPVHMHSISNIKKSEPVELKQKNWEDKQILIVEDDDQSFIFYERVLKKTGIKIFRAIDGPEAIDFYRKGRFDLILMDIRIPKMDGYITTEKIKAIDPTVKIIAQTAYALAGEKQRCLDSGCVDYIAKPISISGFLTVIEKYI
jgi:PAS domain S-box-containing protein